MIIIRDVNHLQGLLESAAKAHHEAEKRLPAHSWARWYAAYIAARAISEALPRAAAAQADAFAQAPVDPHSGSAF